MELLSKQDGVRAAEDWLQDRLKRYRVGSLFLPAGETPKRLYAEWRAHPPAYLRGLRLLQVDDVLDGPGQGMFARFFAEELPGVEVVPPVREDSADLAILGLGTNGHVAFHEPGLPPSFSFGEVALAADTVNRLNLPLGTRGVTYGVGAFLRAKAILLIVKGASKKAAWERFEKGDASLPATALKAHSDLSVWVDLT